MNMSPVAAVSWHIVGIERFLLHGCRSRVSRRRRDIFLFEGSERGEYGGVAERMGIGGIL